MKQKPNICTIKLSRKIIYQLWCMWCQKILRYKRIGTQSRSSLYNFLRSDRAEGHTDQYLSIKYSNI